MNSESMRKKFAVLTLLFVLMIAGCSKNSESVNEPLDNEPNTAYVYLDSTRQLIRGFGGVNMPGWIDDMTTDQINKAFGTGPGQIGMSILLHKCSNEVLVL